MKDKLFAGDVDSLHVLRQGGRTASRSSRPAARTPTRTTCASSATSCATRTRTPSRLLGAVNGEKVTLLAVCGKNAVARGIKAGDIIKNIAPIVGGKGGGKPDSAMGGGTNALKLDDALAAVDDYVAANVKD